MRQSPFQSIQNRQIQVARMGQPNPFQHVQQMMMSFGGLHQDPFMNSMMMMPFGDPFQDMFNFSDMHKNVHSRGIQGSYVCQSFVSSSKMGPDGKIIRQNYFQNNMGEHRGGQTISQKQQAYKNTDGLNRIAQQRMLNDKGRKIVRQKRGNQIQETNHYYNIDEQQSQQFDNEWGQVNQNMKFLQNHQRYLQKIEHPNYIQIGYQPIRQQHPRQFYQQQQQQRQITQKVPQYQNSQLRVQPNTRIQYQQQPIRRQVQQPLSYQRQPQQQYQQYKPSNSTFYQSKPNESSRSYETRRY